MNKQCPELTKNNIGETSTGVRVVDSETFILSQKVIDVCLNCPYPEKCVLDSTRKDVK